MSEVTVKLDDDGREATIYDDGAVLFSRSGELVHISREQWEALVMTRTALLKAWEVHR